jgi:hypothetical protein
MKCLSFSADYRIGDAILELERAQDISWTAMTWNYSAWVRLDAFQSYVRLNPERYPFFFYCAVFEDHEISCKLYPFS